MAPNLPERYFPVYRVHMMSLMVRNEVFPSTRTGQANHTPTLPPPFRPSVRPSSFSSSSRSRAPLSLSHHNSRYSKLKHDEKDWIKVTKRGKTLHNLQCLSCTATRCPVYAAKSRSFHAHVAPLHLWQLQESDQGVDSVTDMAVLLCAVPIDGGKPDGMESEPSGNVQERGDEREGRSKDVRFM